MFKKRLQPLFKQLIQEDDEVSEIIDLSFKLEGIARNVGKHAGGIVIAPGKITDFCPTYVDEQSQSVMTQYDKDDVETIGQLFRHHLYHIGSSLIVIAHRHK